MISVDVCLIDDGVPVGDVIEVIVGAKVGISDANSVVLGVVQQA